MQIVDSSAAANVAILGELKLWVGILIHEFRRMSSCDRTSRNGTEAASFNAGCTMTTVCDSHQQRRLRVAVFVVATVSLLLLLFAAHTVDDHGVALACFALLPVFLFGTVVVQDCLWRILPVNDRLRDSTVRLSLFQRPPPVTT